MIKSFNSLQEAIKYKINCPSCNSTLDIDQANDIMSIDEKSIGFSLLDKDILYINYTNSLLKIKKNDKKNSLGVKYKYSGLSYHKLNIACNCGMFEFFLKITVDLTNLLLKSISLNSERISVEHENMLYEIHNNYSINSTNYTYYINDEAKKQNLPLVILDLDNPLRSLNKLKKLLTFI